MRARPKQANYLSKHTGAQVPAKGGHSDEGSYWDSSVASGMTHFGAAGPAERREREAKLAQAQKLAQSVATQNMKQQHRSGVGVNTAAKSVAVGEGSILGFGGGGGGGGNGGGGGGIISYRNLDDIPDGHTYSKQQIQKQQSQHQRQQFISSFPTAGINVLDRLSDNEDEENFWAPSTSPSYRVSPKKVEDVMQQRQNHAAVSFGLDAPSNEPRRIIPRQEFRPMQQMQTLNSEEEYCYERAESKEGNAATTPRSHKNQEKAAPSSSSSSPSGGSKLRFATSPRNGAQTDEYYNSANSDQKRRQEQPRKSTPGAKGRGASSNKQHQAVQHRGEGENDRDWDDDDDSDEDIRDQRGYSSHDRHRDDDYYDSPLHGAATKTSRSAEASKQTKDKVVFQKRDANAKERKLNGGGSSFIAPTLPCEVKPNQPPPLPSFQDESNMTPKEKLYFSKQPRAVEYRPYTLEQYKLIRPKNYVEIAPTLKPDLNTDVLKAKRANAERIKEFSKGLMRYNQDMLHQQRKLPQSAEANDMEISKQKNMSKRERALQFAKNVPKPKVASSGYGGNAQQGGEKYGLGADDQGDDEDWAGRGYDHDYVTSSDTTGMDYAAANRLDELEAKHEASKRQIEAIKRSLKI